MTTDGVAATIDRTMTRKPNITTRPTDHQAVVTPARIRYLRTGGRRPTAPKVGTVPGVRSIFA